MNVILCSKCNILGSLEVFIKYTTQRYVGWLDNLALLTRDKMKYLNFLLLFNCFCLTVTLDEQEKVLTNIFTAIPYFCMVSMFYKELSCMVRS